MRRLQFTSWFPLVRADVRRQAPDEAAAVQVRREDGLVAYSSGRSSAMVCYVYAADDARQTIEDLFDDELDNPGIRGQGPLMFRYITGGDRVYNHLKKLLHKFHTHFDEMPLFNQQTSS